jgi:hypothetical protein
MRDLLLDEIYRHVYVRSQATGSIGSEWQAREKMGGQNFYAIVGVADVSKARQATLLWPDTAIKDGFWREHIPTASGQRGWKRQPEGILKELHGSVVKKTACGFWPSPKPAEASMALV